VGTFYTCGELSGGLLRKYGRLPLTGSVGSAACKSFLSFSSFNTIRLIAAKQQPKNRRFQDAIKRPLRGGFASSGFIKSYTESKIMSELVTVAFVAKRLSVSRKRIYQLIQAGQLESLRTSPRAIRITRESVDRFIQNGIKREKMELGLDIPPGGSRRVNH